MTCVSCRISLGSLSGRAYTRPEQLSRVRGFFHVVGLAAYSPGDFGEFIDSLDDLTTMLASPLILRMRKGE